MQVRWVFPRDPCRGQFRVMDHGAPFLVHCPVAWHPARIGITQTQIGPPLALKPRFPSLSVEGADCESRDASIIFDNERKTGF